MTEEVKAEFPIGKTQWAKWGPKAREAFNHIMRLGFEFATAVEEANAVQAKVRSAALDELALLGQELDALVAIAENEPERSAEVIAKISAMEEPTPPQAANKPRVSRKKKA